MISRQRAWVPLWSNTKIIIFHLPSGCPCVIHLLCLEAARCGGRSARPRGQPTASSLALACISRGRAQTAAWPPWRRATGCRGSPASGYLGWWRTTAWRRKRSPLPWPWSIARNIERPKIARINFLVPFSLLFTKHLEIKYDMNHNLKLCELKLAICNLHRELTLKITDKLQRQFDFRRRTGVSILQTNFLNSYSFLFILL